LDPSKRTIALLPGSRRSEVTYHLPPMIEAAEHLSRKMEVQFLLIRASTIKSDDLEEMANRATARISFSEGNTYNALNACDLAWAASGTATLETALMLKPMIVVYRLAWLTYVMARLLVRVNYIGMVNIVAGERVVPELIQAELTAERIVRESELILRDSELRQGMVAKLAEVRGKLGSPGAAGRVADIALTMMN